MTTALTRLPSARPLTFGITGDMTLPISFGEVAPDSATDVADDRAQLLVGQLRGQVALRSARPRAPRRRRGRRGRRRGRPRRPPGGACARAGAPRSARRRSSFSAFCSSLTTSRSASPARDRPPSTPSSRHAVPVRARTSRSSVGGQTDCIPASDGGHLRLLRHADRLGGRRGLVPVRARAPPRRGRPRPARRCASAGRRSSSSASRVPATAPTVKSWPTASRRGASERGYRWNDRGGRGARALDGELAAVPRHGAGAARGEARPACGCGSCRTPTARSWTTRCASWTSSSTASRWPRTAAPTSPAAPRSSTRCARSASRRRILHVAFGFKYDIATAQSLGMRTAWVNRAGEERPGRRVPDHEWSDLWPLG